MALHLRQEEIVVRDDELALSATVETPNRDRFCLWYRVPRECRDALTSFADPFVLGILFLAMEEGQDVVVHGALSASLLENLGEFQARWQAWRPRRYHHVRITATEEAIDSKTGAEPAHLLAFSGGVDSCFAAFNLRDRKGGSEACLDAGLMVHGFDIPLAQTQIFDRAANRSARMLASLGMPLIRISTNFRELPQAWEDAHGAGIASCLTLFAGRYSQGLIGSGPSEQALVLPYGSNPMTDPLMSSRTFRIVHYGIESSRMKKISRLSLWTEALEDLRVCWEGPRLDENCCQCEKCIRTILTFRVLGLELPACFPRDVGDAQIRRARAPQAQIEVDFEPILLAAETAGLADSWVDALRTCIDRNRRRNRLKSLWRRWKQT